MKLFKLLLAIVVALTMISCATMGTTTTQPFSDSYATQDHSDDYEFGWNYIFPFENNGDYWILMFLDMGLRPVASVAPINFYVTDDEIEEAFIGSWVWTVNYKTDLDEGFNVEMGISPTAEEAVEAVEYFLETFLSI